MKKENYLDFVPRHSKVMPWQENEAGHVEIKRENLGVFNRIAQAIAKKLRFSYIDGKKTIYQIGQAVHEEFGEKAEPLYERLSKYITTLHENRFVVYQNKITS